LFLSPNRHRVCKSYPVQTSFILFNQMAFNPEVALFNLLEDAQTSEELLAVIDDFQSEDSE